MTLSLQLTARAARAADPVTLRFSASSPPSDFLSLAMATFKSEVERTTGGAATDTASRSGDRCV